MELGLILLEVEHKLPMPAWLFGVIGFGLLVALLWITMAIGKGRPHS
ncbi:MAG TPA: hypothetical protein VEQ66_14395 [Propionibacteriaceae bacterium]|nr:hypothetical protein [Propionibacteriaceae bacterium]